MLAMSLTNFAFNNTDVDVVLGNNQVQNKNVQITYKETNESIKWNNLAHKRNHCSNTFACKTGTVKQ